MANTEIDLENRPVWIEGDYNCKPVNLKNARVIEGLSFLTETTVEFVSSNLELDLQEMLGKTIHLGLKDDKDESRYFTGICTAVEYVGLYKGMMHFVAEVRPWLWFLGRNYESRVFQDKTVPEIIKAVLDEYGFTGQINKLTETYEKRIYCVQYDETDFDFISRLMEEEGIYYFFVQAGADNKELKMVLADGIAAHKPNTTGPDLDFYFKEAEYRRSSDHIFDWAHNTSVTTGKVTLKDYDFEKPRADLQAVSSVEKGKHAHKKYENYRYPGHMRLGHQAANFAKVRMQAEAVRHKLARGAGNVRTLGVGQTFKLKGHTRTSVNIEYLVVRAEHRLQIENDYEDQEPKKLLFDTAIPVDKDNKDTYRITFDVIPKTEPFRAPQETRWPRVAGLQTAVVTGPEGEEIYTDKYGRIKVQFHWDRQGKNDENTTCWVRCVMPWTGKNWGMISVPRIGQEVAIQFEEGDPDRPICTGMLYNADTMPPYDLPANATQTGIVTRSTKQGSAKTFNELIFEDKKDAEFVRFQSERDYTQTIKNNATVTIGLEHKDKGDLTQTIHRHKTEIIKTGDHTFKVETGNQVVFINTDHTETIKGKATQTITGDTTQKVETGNFVQDIDSGNLTRKVAMGNEAVTVSMGDYSLKTALGSIKEEAMQEIELKVGSSSIKIDQMGVTIKGMMIKIEGTMMVEAKAPMTTVKGDAMLVLKGGITMIN